MGSVWGSQAAARGFHLAVRSPLVEGEVRRLRRMEGWNSDRVAEYQDHRASQVQAFAARFSPHYRAVGASEGPQGLGSITTKEDIRRGFDDYRLRWMPARTVTTGGTNGVPAMVSVSIQSTLIEWGHIAYTWGMAGVDVTCPKLTFRGSTLGQGFAERPFFYQATYNHFAVSPFHLSPGLFQNLLDEMGDFRPVAIWGYPSAITPFAQWVREVGPLPALQSIRAVLLASEGAFDWQVELFKQAFGAAVVRWYGQSEKVAFASGCPRGDDAYHVHPTYGQVELVDDRIVATGFTNRAMPLLRYDTEDTAGELQAGCECGSPFPTLKKVRGRWDQMLLWGAEDEPISTSALNFHDKAFMAFGRFQFRQVTAGDATLLVLPRPGSEDLPTVLRAAQAVLQRRVGDRLRISVEVAAPTEFLSKLGKGIPVDQRYQPTAVGRTTGERDRDASVPLVGPSAAPPDRRPAVGQLAGGRPAVQRKRIIFYARVDDIAKFALIEFYSEDIRALERLGFEVLATNSVRTVFASRGDYLFAWWWHSAFPVLLGWRLLGRSSIVTGSTELFERISGGVVRRSLRGALTVAGSRLASANIAPSESERSKLEKVRAPGLRRVHHSVDTTFFRLETKSDSPSAVIVAQLNPLSIRRKGVDTALRALTRARRLVPDLTLTIVGPISPEGQVRLKQLAEEVDFTGVEIVGEVEREMKRAILARSWLYLQPSLYEGFGVAVLEAMACGCVPVSSKQGALWEVVGDAGRFVPAAEPEALAAAMVELVHDGSLREHLGKRARQRSELFDSSMHVEGFRQILREMKWLPEEEGTSR